MKKLIILLFISINLFAYVRLKNPQMINVYWGIDNVPITFKLGYYQQQVMTAIRAWEDPRSYLNFTMIAEQNDVFKDNSDYKNSIKFVNSNDSWHYADGSPSGFTYFDSELGFDSSVVAYTESYTEENTRSPGKLLDVDIVVALDRVNLQLQYGMDHLTEILVHEMGHFIGLEHYCELDANIYKGIPACQPINPAYVLKVPVMHYMPLDPRRIFLTDDDRAGLLSIYHRPGSRKSGCGIFGIIDISTTNDGGGNSAQLLILLIPFLVLLLLRKEFIFSKEKSTYKK